MEALRRIGNIPELNGKFNSENSRTTSLKIGQRQEIFKYDATNNSHLPFFDQLFITIIIDSMKRVSKFLLKVTIWEVWFA